MRRVEFALPSTLDTWLVSAVANRPGDGIQSSGAGVDEFGRVLRDIFHQDSVECTVAITKKEVRSLRRYKI